MIKFLSLYFSVFWTILISGFLSAQQTTVTEINGGNWVPILENSQYFIDYSDSLSAQAIPHHLSDFQKNNSGSLTLGKQPHPIWIRIQLKNTGKAQKYWLGVYSQLDTLWVYKKEGETLRLKKISSYARSPYFRDSLHQVRFHLAVFEMKENERLDLFLKVSNKRHFTNIYADFTTPEGNLQWENTFYWKQGFFFGCFFLGIVLSFIFGMYARKKLFFVYGFYLIFSILIILQEELNISVFENGFLYSFFYQLNTLFLLPVNMGLNLYILNKITGIEIYCKKTAIWLERFALFLIFSGLVLSVLYYFNFQNLGFQKIYFSILWDIVLGVLGISVFAVSGVVAFYFFRNRNYFFAIVLPLVLWVLNPVSYFLNYSKTIVFYEITHPNYYYYFLVAEIFLLGVLIAIQYRNTQRSNINYLKEKIEVEKNYSSLIQEQERKIQNSILESQEHLLKNLSQDLHDDIGQRLSIIHFSIENLKLMGKNNELIDEIQHSVLEISGSLRDLSHWLNDFDIRSASFDKTIENEIIRLNKNIPIHFEFELIQHPTANFKTTAVENIILYRIFQEATHNIIKHSQAKNAWVQIDYTEKLALTLKDDGRGMDLSQPGKGIQNIQHRAQLIDYEFELKSSKQDGTEIKLTKK